MPLNMFVSLLPTSRGVPCLCWHVKDKHCLDSMCTGKQLSGQVRWQRVVHDKPRAYCIRSISCSGTANRSSKASISSQEIPASAREAVQGGQQAFDRAEYDEALRLFSAAMTLKPNDDEARAALYNAACAKVKLKDWQGAADDVSRAVNDYRLKLDVAVKVRILRIVFPSMRRDRCVSPNNLMRSLTSKHYMHAINSSLVKSHVREQLLWWYWLITWPCCVQDPDLRALRDRREWPDAMERTKGGVSGKAYASARAESKSPFRLVRLLTFGGLGAGAGIGLFIILGRLFSAL